MQTVLVRNAGLSVRLDCLVKGSAKKLANLTVVTGLAFENSLTVTCVTRLCVRYGSERWPSGARVDPNGANGTSVDDTVGTAPAVDDSFASADETGVFGDKLKAE